MSNVYTHNEKKELRCSGRLRKAPSIRGMTQKIWEVIYRSGQNDVFGCDSCGSHTLYRDSKGVSLCDFCHLRQPYRPFRT